MSLRRLAAALDLDAPPNDIWTSLADLGRYADWLPMVDRVQLLAREGDLAVIELSGPPTLVLEALLSPGRRVSFHEVGKLREGWAVEVSLTAHGDGTRVELSAMPPGAVRWLFARRRVRRWLDDALAALAGHLGLPIETPSRSRARRADGRQLVAELRRSPRGLELWIAGTTVALPARSQR